MLRYRVRVPARDPEASTLLITPLTKDWIPAAAEVLTDSFAVSLGAAPYTNFLRRQVRTQRWHGLGACLQHPPSIPDHSG